MTKQPNEIRIDRAHTRPLPPHFDNRVSPEVYAVVADAVQENGSDLASIAEMIEQDKHLSEMVLALINSATFALKHEIRTVSQAVALLGARRLRRFLRATNGPFARKTVAGAPGETVGSKRATSSNNGHENP